MKRTWWRKTQEKDRPKKRRARGQGMVETALLFPVLLIVLSGMVEFGFMLNDYLSIMDATRNAARFSSDSDYTTIEPNESVNRSCESTLDFFRQTLCLVCMNLEAIRPTLGSAMVDGSVTCFDGDPDTYCPDRATQPIGFKSAPNSNSDAMTNCPLDSSRDQIIITIYSVSSGEEEYNLGYYSMPRGVPFPASPITQDDRRIGYSEVDALLDRNAPSTGYLVVELFYNYDQRLALPWVRAFIPDPVLLHTYAVMPLVSAEPKPAE